MSGKNFVGDFIGYEPYSQTNISGIDYNYNNLGHRCQNVDDIDLNNYILFTGCSHTEGYGLPLEKSYPFLTSKKLGLDYYNLALSGTGFDVVFHNLMIWVQIYKKPKCLVIQYPNSARFSIIKENNIQQVGSWTTDNKLQSFLIDGEESGFFGFRNKSYIKILEKIVDNPIIKLSFDNIIPIDKAATLIRKMDYAIDNLHFGPVTHMNVADIVSDKYINARNNNLT